MSCHINLVKIVPELLLQKQQNNQHTRAHSRNNILEKKQKQPSPQLCMFMIGRVIREIELLSISSLA